MLLLLLLAVAVVGLARVGGIVGGHSCWCQQGSSIIVVCQHPHLPLQAVARRLGGGAVSGRQPWGVSGWMML